MRPHAPSKCSIDQSSQGLGDSSVRLCEFANILTHWTICTLVSVERLGKICVKYTRERCRQCCTKKQ